ncbi:MAG: acyl carrier protein [Lachnospiraceae bacterium]|nr:acyl carrier protein [Lachnospiraceae bacterium]
MERQELEAKMIELVAIAFKKDAADITMETSFKNDLGGASVQMVALVSEIENELDAVIMLADASQCATVGELTDLVEEEL